MKNMKIKYIVGHIKRILIHKYWVFHYCCKFRIIWRGITHDLSKFHPTEFFESVKYYSKESSPIPRCKADKGYSLAWQHHKGHNDHHYEYWVDNLDKGGVPIKIPFNCILEMLADWLAAGKAYKGSKFREEDEYNWFENFTKLKPKIHNESMMIIHAMMNHIRYYGLRNFDLNSYKTQYNKK